MGYPAIKIEPDLVTEATQLGIDVNHSVNTDLRRRIEKRKRELAWQAENKEAIDSYNRFIDEHGLWHERFRNR
jgi:post-segregation antitoxin (ccd killing protein)